MCGYDGLWRALTAREVLTHIPDRRNTLIVYGPASRPNGRLLPEEYAALHQEHMWGYDELMHALRPTRYDRLLDLEWAEKPEGRVEMPLQWSYWERAGIRFQAANVIHHSGLVTMMTDVERVLVNWWNPEDRNQWHPSL
jgi:hypothetical protein